MDRTRSIVHVLSALIDFKPEAPSRCFDVRGSRRFLSDMIKTDRLYYTDSYLTEFECRVERIEPHAGQVRVYLDRTAFYPDSGGQPSDQGTLGGLRVVEVIDEDEGIAHMVEGIPEGERLQARIDWVRRFDHMQQHTGQHILSAAFEKSGGYKTLSFHLGRQISSIDLNSDRLGRRQIDQAEDLANGVVFEDRPVRLHFKPASEANALGLRKPTDLEGEVRLVEIEEFDLSACGGTHVRRTGEVGVILVRRFERAKGLTRIEFVCGQRALHSARSDFLSLTEAARLLSTGPENVPSMIARQTEDYRSASRARLKLLERLAEYRAATLWQAAPEKKGRRLIRLILESQDDEEAKLLAHAVAKAGPAVGLIGIRGKPARLYFSQSPGRGSDLGAIMKEVAGRVGGKGGGSRDFAQGGGFDEARLEEAFAAAEELLSREN